MTQIEAIFTRHSVRRYKDMEIPKVYVSLLNEKIAELNFRKGLHIQLVTNEPKSFESIKTYGSFSNVKNYLVMAGKESPDLEEKIGYCGEQLVLMAQAMGLNSCWTGVSYSKVKGTYELEKNEKIICYIALGFGENQGVPHKIKSYSEVSNINGDSPIWFIKGVRAALFAPTAVNQQKFFIEYLGKDPEIKMHKVSVKALFSLVGFTKVDLGIVKCHFDIGANSKKYIWV